MRGRKRRRKSAQTYICTRKQRRIALLEKANRVFFLHDTARHIPKAQIADDEYTTALLWLKHERRHKNRASVRDLRVEVRNALAVRRFFIYEARRAVL